MANHKIKEIAAGLRAAQEGFDKKVLEVPSDQFHRCPSEGEWSPAQIVAHVCESSLFLSHSAQRMAKEDNPFIGRDEQGMQARDQALAEWSQDDLAAACRRLQGANTEALAIVEGLGDNDLDRTGQHPRLGQPTVERLLQMVISHYGDHTNQVSKCVGG
jgi:hypothetical protein